MFTIFYNIKNKYIWVFESKDNKRIVEQYIYSQYFYSVIPILIQFRKDRAFPIPELNIFEHFDASGNSLLLCLNILSE